MKSNTQPGTSLVAQWLRPRASEPWVQSLVRELTSHMPRGQKNKLTEAQNHNKTPHHTRHAWEPSIKTVSVGEDAKKPELCALLVETQNGTATGEKGEEVPPKI